MNDNVKMGPIVDVERLEQKTKHVSDLLEQVLFYKAELAKCGLYMTETITTNQEEFAKYLAVV